MEIRQASRSPRHAQDVLRAFGFLDVWDLADNASVGPKDKNQCEGKHGRWSERGRIECEDDFWRLRVTDGRILEEEGRTELGMGWCEALVVPAPHTCEIAEATAHMFRVKAEGSLCSCTLKYQR